MNTLDKIRGETEHQREHLCGVEAILIELGTLLGLAEAGEKPGEEGGFWGKEGSGEGRREGEEVLDETCERLG